MEFIAQNKAARFHVVFLSDYDMSMTEKLVSGVDVWINTPRRPWEACGTSGMKVLANGGINLSELDGWWAEAYTPEVGWAMGDAKEHGDDPVWEVAEANELYRLLEEEVIPLFYHRDDEGIPMGWTRLMKKSMSELTLRFSAERSVQEYTEKYYIPAAKRYGDRLYHFQENAASISRWRHMLNLHWPKLRFSQISVTQENECYLFNIQVYLDGIDTQAIKVEIYADANEDEGLDRVCQEMQLIRPLSGAPNCYLYQTRIPMDRPEEDFTARIVPFYEGINVPLEEHKILWQPR